jgi:hypothetical protein
MLSAAENMQQLSGVDTPEDPYEVTHPPYTQFNQ